MLSVKFRQQTTATGLRKISERIGEHFRGTEKKVVNKNFGDV
jgi:hypothetical protein